MSPKVSCSAICIVAFTIINKVMGLIGGKVMMTADNSAFANTTYGDRNITLLHISRHTGCMRDIYSISTSLGIRSEVMYFDGPLKITKALADTIWTNNSAYYNNFDYILTTDTTPISRIFLQNLNAFNGKLIIYVSNRFDVGMKDDMEWVQLFIYATKRKDKVTIVPFCEFEKVHAAAKGVHIWEYPTIYPLGDLPPKGNAEFENFISDYDLGAFGPKGDAGVHRTVTTSNNMTDTYYINHYMNEQDTRLFEKCYYGGMKCFIGYASNVSAFKAMISFPNSACNIAPFDTMVRGIVALVPTHRLLADAVAGKVPGFKFAFLSDIANATEYCTWLMHPECRISFDTFDELFQLMKTLDDKAIDNVRTKCAATVSSHRNEVLRLWGEIFEPGYFATSVSIGAFKDRDTTSICKNLTSATGDTLKNKFHSRAALRHHCLEKEKGGKV